MGKGRLAISRMMRPLVVVAVMLVGSAGLRFAEGAGVVLKGAPTLFAFAEGSDDKVCVTAPDLDLLMKSLQSRETELVAQAEAVVARETTLAQNEADLARRKAAFEAERAELAYAQEDFNRQKRSSAAANSTDIAQLISMYESMKPKEASALFEAMSPDFAAGFLREMSPETAASILAGVSPEFAYAVSVLLAGYNAVPENSGG